MREFYKLNFYGHDTTLRIYRNPIENSLLAGHFKRKFLINLWEDELPLIIVSDNGRYYEFFTKTEVKLDSRKVDESVHYGEKTVYYNNYFSVEECGYSVIIEDDDFEAYYDHIDEIYVPDKSFRKIAPDAALKCLKKIMDDPKKTQDAEKRIIEYFGVYRQKHLKYEEEKSKSEADAVAARRRHEAELTAADSALNDFLDKR